MNCWLTRDSTQRNCSEAIVTTQDRRRVQLAVDRHQVDDRPVCSRTSALGSVGVS